MKYLVLLCLPLLAAPRAFAEYKFGFADVSVNALDWSTGTERKSSKRDFNFIELEGYAQYDWGDIYGFFDYENPGHRGDEVRSSSKIAVHRLVGWGGLSVFGQVFNFSAHGFYEQNRVLGLGYIFQGEGWWFKPWAGFHEVSQSFFSGPNGFMAGWSMGYNFTLWSYRFMIADWHEFEFERKSAYSSGQGGVTSHNGALSLWLNPHEKISVGVQHRYAVDKLGTAGTQNAVIYTVKYFF